MANYSGSFEGDGSLLKKIDYYDLENLPRTINAFQANSVLANNALRDNFVENVKNRLNDENVISSSAQLTTEFDIRYGNEIGDELVSGSSQIDFYGIDNLPTGLVSSSAQIEISESQISDLTHYTDSDVKSKLDSEGVISGSSQIEISESQISDLQAYLTSLPEGTISSSAQITELGYITSETDAQTLSYVGETLSISNGNSVTIPTGSDLPDGVVSSSAQIAELGYITTETDSQTLTFNQVNNKLTISDGNTVDLSTLVGGGSSGGSSIWATGSNYYHVSADLQVTGSFSAVSLTGSIDWDNIDNAPNGIISSSVQITNIITDLYISESAARSGFGSSGGGSFGDPPTIDQTGLQITEYVVSGSTIGTLSVTDVTPGDTATWEIQSGYTDDFFKISNNGVVTANTLVTSSMNTTAGSGSNNSHLFQVKVTDGQNNVVNGDVYIYVIPNSSPVFRETSVGGNIITSFTGSVNENSTNGSILGTIYFTDENSDTITIETGSIPSQLSVTVNPTNVVITQNTASFDYETTTSYDLAITASDEHYQRGEDGGSISHIPVLISIVDNIAPIVNNQTLTTINENSSAGTSLGTISATDNESDTITFSNFTLKRAYVNGIGTNVTASMGGTSLYDPHPNPFQMNSSGVVTRKAGIYLNADVADRYEYEVSVGDSFNNTTDTGIITIPIGDDSVSTISDNWTNVYVIESAVDGDLLKIGTNGRTGTTAQWSSTTSQRWEVSSDNDLIEVTNLTGSTTQLRVKNDISGSIYSFDGTNTINVALTASEAGFETTKQYIDLEVNVSVNNAPNISFTNTSANLNTNGARSGSLLTTVSFSDIEGDSIDFNSFVFTDASNQLNAVRSGDNYLIQPINNLSGSVYEFSVGINDEHGFSTNVENHSITIAQADTGTLSTNGTFYVIESATNGDNIVLGTNGRTGTQGDLGVNYSPQYNSAAVASFTSSNALISVASNGNLSVGTDINGSGNLNGDTITSNITWQDQYGNVGGPTSITINITENFAPTATDTPETNNLNTNLGTDGTKLATLTWSDTESDDLNIGSFTLTGAGISNISSSYDGENIFSIYANGNQSAGVISYTASIEDVYGFSVGTYNDDITIAQSGGGTINANGTFYIIESALSGSDITTNSNGIAGTIASVGVSYSPNYGSQIAEQFNLGSGHPFISIDSDSGNLSINDNISGSEYQNGSNLTSNVYWLDQYGNEGTGSVTVNITDNQNATATFTDESLIAPILSGSLLVSAELTDPETQTPFSMSLSGLSATKISAESQNASNSSYELRLLEDIPEGVTLSYTASVFDDYNQKTDYKRTLVVAPPIVPDPLLYVYVANHSSDAGLSANYNGSLGIGTVNSETPPEITSYNANTLSLTYLLKTGELGESTINLAASKVANLVASPIATGSVTAIIEDLGSVSLNNTGQVLLVIPSGSDNINGLPTSMGSGFGGSTLHEYTMQVQADGGGWSNTIEGTTINKITLDTAVDGFTDWFIIGRTGFNAFGSSMELRVIPSSGSAQS